MERQATASPRRTRGMHPVSPPVDMSGAREIRFAASDGFPLGGTLFPGDGDGPLVLISSATAVPQRLYAGFARALVEADARAVLTYDYRGTGASPRAAGWNGRIGMKDWALLDFPAAMAALDAIAPGHPMTGVGQSFGGQALGLSGRSGRFARYANVAAMSGSHRLLDDPWTWPRMNLLGVPISLILGRLPEWAGIGEPLPGSVFRDWARWCRMPNYFFDDPDMPETERFFDVRLPLLSIGMTDDRWGTPRAVEHLLARYANAQIEERWIGPDDADGQSIGHLGYFRSRFEHTLWPPLVRWLVRASPFTIGKTRSELPDQSSRRPSRIR